MVKVVVRDGREIVRAYLQGLGFGSGCNPDTLINEHPSLREPNGDIVALLDEIIYTAAAKVLPPQLCENPRHAAALYKALYMELGGAARWGTAPWREDHVNPPYFEEMKKQVFEVVPPYCFSEMPRQVIEPAVGKFAAFLKFSRRKKHD